MACPLVAGLAGLLLGACGGSGSRLPPRAAEPAESPTLTHQPAGTVHPVGREPEGVAVDPGTGLVAVGVRDPDRLLLVDAASGRVVRRVPLPAAPRHLALVRRGGPVLVPAEAANALISVELPSGRRSSTPVGRHPHDATFAAGRSFVSDEYASTVSVVGQGGTRTLPAPLQPGGIASLADRVVVVAVRERVLRTYDARSLRPLDLDSAGVGPTHAVAAAGRVYVADTQGDAVRVYRLHGDQLKFAGRVAAPGAPYGIAVDRRRQRLWVTVTASNRALEYELRGERPRRVATYPTVRQPNSIAVDPRSGAAFVAGRSAGVLERIVPGRSPWRRGGAGSEPQR